MIIAEIVTEGALQIFGRRHGKLVRKYRCTSGQKKGRIVAKPQTCNTPIKLSSRVSAKKARSRKSPLIKIRTGISKRTNPRSKFLTKLNKARLKPTKRKTASKRRRMSR
jgi:hypothetical protein